jgi:hypothetical protein
LILARKFKDEVPDADRWPPVYATMRPTNLEELRASVRVCLRQGASSEELPEHVEQGSLLIASMSEEDIRFDVPLHRQQLQRRLRNEARPS